jgi:hypothetical protein
MMSKLCIKSSSDIWLYLFCIYKQESSHCSFIFNSELDSRCVLSSCI